MIVYLKLKNESEEMKIDFIHNIYEQGSNVVLERKKDSNMVFGIDNIESFRAESFEKGFNLDKQV